MKKTNINLDVIKAMRRGSRIEEQMILGPGFHSKNKVHKSKKLYSRKNLKKKFILKLIFDFYLLYLFC
jgi:hypothetical protein